jgi:hypothetical protein
MPARRARDSTAHALLIPASTAPDESNESAPHPTICALLEAPLIRAFLRCRKGWRDCLHNLAAVLPATEPGMPDSLVASGLSPAEFSAGLGATRDVSRLQRTLTPIPGLFHSVLTQGRGNHDCNRTASQTVNVVSDGARQMDERVAGQQSLQPGAVESREKRTVQDFFPAPPLVGSREVLSMLRLGLHDVEVGRSRCEDGILRARRQPAAEFVF